MNSTLRFRLCAMMFLQYAIWGAWAPVLYPYLADTLKFTGAEAGYIFGTLWLACIISPFIGGQIADRWFPTQWFLAIVHLAGGAILLITSHTKDYGPMLWMMFAYSLLYAPTLALTNSLTFHHLKDVEKEFGAIRVMGTIGWIVAGLVLTGLRNVMPSLGQGRSDCLFLAGCLSVLMGIFCLTLPHTPPRRENVNPLAFVDALKLLRDKNFLIFIIISFVVTTELQFYYMPTGSFLQSIGISQKSVPAVMTVAQIAEIIAMAVFLPKLLPLLGVRKALAIGVIAWPIRYLVFALQQPTWLVVASLTLHGIGYTFFFVVSQIYVDQTATKDIRASAQSLLTLVTLGLGNYIGTWFTGRILDSFKDSTGAQQWTPVFLVPCALTIACAIAFLIGFRAEPKVVQQEAAT